MTLIATAADARRLIASARPFVASPPSFHGTLQELADQFILPNLPTAESVKGFHAALVDYIAHDDALFLLRAVSGTERRKVQRTRDGTRFKATDNAPAWWVHAALLQGYTIPLDAFANVMETLPTHFHDVPKTCGLTANAAGWHTAHIFNVKDGRTHFVEWSRSEVIGRFIRNVHPCNYFLLPKTDWQRWGGDARVLGYFGALYAERYAEVWPAFLALARANASGLPRVTGPIAYSYPEAVSRSEDAIANSAAGVCTERMSTGRDVEYRASRLTFKRDVIEALDEYQLLRIVTPSGTFAMTKADVYRAFPKMVETRSYRDAGTYNYARLPQAAEAFRVGNDSAADSDVPSDSAPALPPSTPPRAHAFVHHFESAEHQRIAAALQAYRRARDELTQLGVVRSERNIPGEYGEWLVARLLDLTLAPSSIQAGYDATDSAGLRYQIKVRCVADVGARTSFDVKDSALPFDVLLGVLLSPAYELLAIVDISRAAFDEHAVDNRASTRLRWSPTLFDEPWVVVRYRLDTAR